MKSIIVSLGNFATESLMFNSDDETEKDFGVNMTTEVVDGKTYYKCTEEKKVVKTIRNALDNSDEYCQKCGIEAEDFC